MDGVVDHFLRFDVLLAFLHILQFIVSSLVCETLLLVSQESLVVLDASLSDLGLLIFEPLLFLSLALNILAA